MMTTPTPHIVLLLLLLSSLPASAGNWRTVVDNEIVRAETDIGSLMRNGDIVRTWEKETYLKPEQAKPGDFYYKSAKSLAQHHCTNRTTSYLYKAYYTEDGKEIKAITSAGDLDRADQIPPDSLEERKLLFACNFKSSPAYQAKPSISQATAETPANDKDKKTPATVAPPSKKSSAQASSDKPSVSSKNTKPNESKPTSTTKSAGGK